MENFNEIYNASRLFENEVIQDDFEIPCKNFVDRLLKGTGLVVAVKNSSSLKTLNVYFKTDDGNPTVLTSVVGNSFLLNELKQKVGLATLSLEGDTAKKRAIDLLTKVINFLLKKTLRLSSISQLVSWSSDSSGLRLSTSSNSKVKENDVNFRISGSLKERIYYPDVGQYVRVENKKFSKSTLTSLEESLSTYFSCNLDKLTVLENDNSLISFINDNLNSIFSDGSMKADWINDNEKSSPGPKSKEFSIEWRSSIKKAATSMIEIFRKLKKTDFNPDTAKLIIQSLSSEEEVDSTLLKYNETVRARIPLHEDLKVEGADESEVRIVKNMLFKNSLYRGTKRDIVNPSDVYAISIYEGEDVKDVFSSLAKISSFKAFSSSNQVPKNFVDIHNILFRSGRLVGVSLKKITGEPSIALSRHKQFLSEEDKEYKDNSFSLIGFKYDPFSVENSTITKGVVSYRPYGPVMEFSTNSEDIHTPQIEINIRDRSGSPSVSAVPKNVHWQGGSATDYFNYLSFGSLEEDGISIYDKGDIFFVLKLLSSELVKNVKFSYEFNTSKIMFKGSKDTSKNKSMFKETLTEDMLKNLLKKDFTVLDIDDKEDSNFSKKKSTKEANERIYRTMIKLEEASTSIQRFSLFPDQSEEVMKTLKDKLKRIKVSVFINSNKSSKNSFMVKIDPANSSTLCYVMFYFFLKNRIEGKPAEAAELTYCKVLARAMKHPIIKIDSSERRSRVKYSKDADNDSTMLDLKDFNESTVDYFKVY